MSVCKKVFTKILPDHAFPLKISNILGTFFGSKEMHRYFFMTKKKRLAEILNLSVCKLP